MMERKYQLVAWTENATDSENARLFMTPSLKSEAQASLIEDIAEIHKEERRSHGIISIDLAIRAVTAFEKMSRFEILTGNSGEGIRYLFCAARYCILEDDCNWAYSDSDLGSYSRFCGELRHEFVRLCEEGMRLAKKFKREDVLLETVPKQMLELYSEHTREERDLDHYLKEVRPWK